MCARGSALSVLFTFVSLKGLRAHGCGACDGFVMSVTCLHNTATFGAAFSSTHSPLAPVSFTRQTRSTPDEADEFLAVALLQGFHHSPEPLHLRHTRAAIVSNDVNNACIVGSMYKTTSMTVGTHRHVTGRPAVVGCVLFQRLDIDGWTAAHRYFQLLCVGSLRE